MLKKASMFTMIIIAIIAFGIFVFPTMYKYDKLEQKYPVMINRITGEAKILTEDGWQSTKQIDSAKTEMINYRNEVIVKIQDQEERIKESVLASVEDQLFELSNQIAENDVVFEEVDENETKSDLSRHEQFMDYSTEKATFSRGDTTDKVVEIMGTPDSTSSNGNIEYWNYGPSIVIFENDIVLSWSNHGNLLLK